MYQIQKPRTFTLTSGPHKGQEHFIDVVYACSPADAWFMIDDCEYVVTYDNHDEAWFCGYRDSEEKEHSTHARFHPDACNN